MLSDALCLAAAQRWLLHLLVIGQNGSGQNGIQTKWYMDKMVYGQNGIRTKWYTNKMVYGQNGIRTKWYGHVQDFKNLFDGILQNSLLALQNYY